MSDAVFGNTFLGATSPLCSVD